MNRERRSAARVLVTGAAGFIGRHTLAPLLAAGYEVHGVTSRAVVGGVPAAASAASLAEAPSAGVRWHHADLLLPGAGAELMGEVRPSHLLHLAWNTRPGAYGTTLENLDWVSASLALLRAFGEVGGRRAVVAGTCSEYAWQRRTHCMEDRTPTRPATLYGAAKHGLHVVAQAWARQAGVTLAWGRIFHLYGPYEHPERLVGGVARALLRGEEARCTHGRQLRDFLYAPDLGGAFAALLLSDVGGPVNMASGRPVRVAEVVHAVAAAAGRPELVSLNALPADPGEPEELTADVRRLRDEVGWVPAHDLSEGAELTVDWWRRALGLGLEREPAL
jgi:nucleoside-diphosphate-sugar epimerase